MDTFSFFPIGHISSCYKQKFGIPRQPNLARINCQLVLDKRFTEESVRGLAEFSHVWIQFVFHETESQGWKQMVRPPRLGGNQKIGVFASRSTFRPNPLGLSVVELKKVHYEGTRVTLDLCGCDCMDGTPIIDIKPYIPYADSKLTALASYATKKPEKWGGVLFTENARLQCVAASKRLNEDLKFVIEEILSFDPRPSYHQTVGDKHSDKTDRIYSMRLYDFDLHWQYCENNKIRVIALDMCE